MGPRNAAYQAHLEDTMVRTHFLLVRLAAIGTIVIARRCNETVARLMCEKCGRKWPEIQKRTVRLCASLSRRRSDRRRSLNSLTLAVKEEILAILRGVRQSPLLGLVSAAGSRRKICQSNEHRPLDTLPASRFRVNAAWTLPVTLDLEAPRRWRLLTLEELRSEPRISSIIGVSIEPLSQKGFSRYPLV